MLGLELLSEAHILLNDCFAQQLRSQSQLWLLNEEYLYRKGYFILKCRSCACPNCTLLKYPTVLLKQGIYSLTGNAAQYFVHKSTQLVKKDKDKLLGKSLEAKDLAWLVLIVNKCFITGHASYETNLVRKKKSARAAKIPKKVFFVTVPLTKAWLCLLSNLSCTCFCTTL